MTKYLISSNYQYYDDFDFRNVCVCDSLEKAEELVEIFKEKIQHYKSIKGYRIWINENEFIKLCAEVRLQDYITEFHKRDDEVLAFIEESELSKLENFCTYFDEDLISLHQFKCYLQDEEKGNLIERSFLNHMEAKLSIEEIPFVYSFLRK